MAENSTRSIGVILERINDLRGDMRENKDQLECLSKEIEDFRLLYTSEHQRVAIQSEAAHRRLDEHEKRLKTIEATMPQLVMMGKILTFVGSAVVVSIVGLIWTIITHQVTLIFP